MATSVDDVLDNILARRIAKEDALRSFNALSQEERDRVMTGLRARLQPQPALAEPAPAVEAAPRLRSVHESDLSEQQKAFLAELSQRFATRMAKSKHNALVHQTHFVDQRKVAGLKRPLKPMQFQLTYARAEGAYLYDVDGNRYVDITGDNGVNFFGHQPGFMKRALIERLEQGYPLVAYSEDLFEAARLFCELTGHERMVFAQTGTEAVMWAIRIARAATGRKKVVIFDGSYHGLSDTVLALKGRNGVSMSAGLGLLQEFADQLIILDYGSMDPLETIAARADEIACVLTEPIQSRFPSRQPVEFIQALRRLTLEKDIVLIFDEMVTGFRAGRKGAESFFKVKPDLATYGKVPGGGMPTGIIAGLAKYLDYVDGGVWGFDDASMPSIKRAVMAGTHTQNSLKVSATRAVCLEMKRLCSAGECEYGSCDCAIGQLNRRTQAMCDMINAYFAERRAPIVIDYFSSLFRFQITDDPYGLVRELLILLLKLEGVETSTSGNCFLNLAHSEDDLLAVIEGFKRSVDTLIEHGFFHESAPEPAASAPPGPATPPTAVRAPEDQARPDLAQLRARVLADLRQAERGGR
ncbi:aminotransferase class III-fold pyridoxal phosphate-dependent enzyme [Chitiniphilus purpureus]|uniref:Aminotransferase class III-fold pyridoxal phosphate-dependent enzyme n=1 Tax=Chitiniphilus purpureus TaxID=2981137 RepID=A0ABY6DWB6_9NEIS|nr:aminotransferase class III-fold pyridoxal phosphate-dependent enzyme [Chitiniphilus sp. CD1]UXY16138.1 aminotransferase class III-fold pyridoxal phosphate-dependent enzyme [Chitiniphilus sp. CD1]